jgi:hypothetical protein
VRTKQDNQIQAELPSNLGQPLVVNLEIRHSSLGIRR